MRKITMLTLLFILAFALQSHAQTPDCSTTAPTNVTIPAGSHQIGFCSTGKDTTNVDLVNPIFSTIIDGVETVAVPTKSTTPASNGQFLYTFPPINILSGNHTVAVKIKTDGGSVTSDPLALIATMAPPQKPSILLVR